MPANATPEPKATHREPTATPLELTVTGLLLGLLVLAAYFAPLLRTAQ